ncbi:MAG: ScyD/ScyE family protein [Micrococcus sp.]|nr:ScyD/ScyE family protein [Micrococcus sp.]
MRIRSALAGAGCLALAATLIAAPAQAAGEAKATPRGAKIVVGGLMAPLTLAVGQRGDVFVTQVMGMDPNVPFIPRLSRVDQRGEVHHVKRLLGPEGELVGVAYHRGNTYHVETVPRKGKDPLSRVIRTSPTGKRTAVSENLWTYERENNPDRRSTYGFTDLRGTCKIRVANYQRAANRPPIFLAYKGIVESHAYQLEVHDGTIYVADAAANAVLKVNERTQEVTSATVIPASPITFNKKLEGFIEETFGGDFPSCAIGKKYVPEPVPTDVVLGPDDDLFVSTLQGGAGEVLPLSKIHRIEQRRGPDRVTIVSGRMRGTTGLDRASNGDLYVAQMFGNEVSVIKNRGGKYDKTAKAAKVFSAVTPADVEVVSDHTLYATTFAPGQLLKYDLKGQR